MPEKDRFATFINFWLSESYIFMPAAAYALSAAAIPCNWHQSNLIKGQFWHI
jgi:hypothetical protein